MPKAIASRKLVLAGTTCMLFVVGTGALGTSSVAGDERDEPTADTKSSYKLDLTPDSAAGLLEVVRPGDDEWRHLRVSWLTDVVAARKRAAAEDKPIVICYTGGAGYNEPLGVC